MKLNIKAGTADFKLYSFNKEGKTTNKAANKVWKSPDTYSNTKLQEEAKSNDYLNQLKEQDNYETIINWKENDKEIKKVELSLY